MLPKNCLINLTYSGGYHYNTTKNIILDEVIDEGENLEILVYRAIVISIHRRQKEKTKFQTLQAASDQARVSSLRNGYSFNHSPYVHPKDF